jgi:signal transduction histidine kinase
MPSAPSAKSRQPFLILTGATVFVSIIGYLDWRTSWEVSFFALYLVPIFIVGWACSQRSAIGFVIFCALMSYFVNVGSAPSQQRQTLRSLNRLVGFVFGAMAGIALRAQREHFRSRLEAIERSRELEHEIVRVSEREQRRIGQDLHDSICQNLAAIDCAAGLLKGKLEARSHEEARSAGEIQDLLRKTLIETRSLARGIFPVQVEKEGLAIAVEELASTVHRMHGAIVNVEIEGEIELKDPEIAMHLYRIAQEAVSNAVRHAHARTITLSLHQTPGHITLAVKDNGGGIPEDHEQGMGLRTIRYRTQLMEGKLTINSDPSIGTLVQCSVPLSNHVNQI